MPTLQKIKDLQVLLAEELKYEGRGVFFFKALPICTIVSLPIINRGRLGLFVATSIFAAFCVVKFNKLAAVLPAEKIPFFELF